MQRVREPSVTAASPQTELSSSSFEISFLGISEQEQEGAKGLRLDGQRLSRLRERELPLANLNVVEFENKGLTLHHKSIIRP